MLPGRGRAPGQGTAAGLQGKTDETGKWAAWHRQASPVVSLAGGEPSAGRGVLGASNPEMPPPPPSPWSRRPRTRAVTTGGPTSLSHPPTQPQDQGCKALAPHDRGRWGAGLWRPRATHEPAASAGTLHTSSPPPSAARSRRARERTRRAERGPGRGEHRTLLCRAVQAGRLGSSPSPSAPSGSTSIQRLPFRSLGFSTCTMGRGPRPALRGNARTTQGPGRQDASTERQRK